MRAPQSIWSELLSPIDLLIKLRLLALIEHACLQHEKIHLGAHKAAITILRRANYWLTTHIETGINDHRTAGSTAKRFDDLPVQRIRFTPDSLNASRVINVRDRRYFRPGNVQLIDSPKFLFFISHLPPVRIQHVCDQEHVATIAVKIEPV